MENTLGSTAGSSRSTVHPHAGGEYKLCMSTFTDQSGSSPRGWGIRLLKCCALGLFRFIPTRVGNTAIFNCSSNLSTVHPHAGGEYGMSLWISVKSPGSSPRGWGIQLLLFVQSMRSRFIPTRVGNTSPERAPAIPAPVHPHAGGEYWFPTIKPAQRSGSSPRGWGIPNY